MKTEDLPSLFPELNELFEDKQVAMFNNEDVDVLIMVVANKNIPAPLATAIGLETLARGHKDILAELHNRIVSTQYNAKVN